ncbi:MAG: flagellar M-ring protein FliF [Desulfobacterales bacterium]|nr:flagellar M-ring protein FliF [Desulfobacterales bacterium]
MAEDIGKTSAPQLKNWPNSRKLLLIVVALVCVGIFGAIILQARHADYRLLYANMANGDGAEVIRWLKEQKIPYRLENNGTTIHIPADQVYEARLRLAGSGLPRGGGVGFEIFDKQSFGMTDFSQKVNYLRALQGELSRTISSLAPVETARVHLVMPEKRVFQAQQQDTTASVILKLVPGSALKESQVQGVINLVAGSIEGLDPGRVTVVDSSGRILSRPPRAEVDGLASSGLIERQLSLERQLEGRAQSLLDRALGLGNSVVRVTATVDFSRLEQTEERYDPDGSVVRSELVTEEKSGGQTAAGVPGVAANLKNGGVSAGAAGTSRSEETVKYELSKTVSRKVLPAGALKSLSVAVLVADRRTPAAGSAPGSEPTYVPRTVEELAVIEKMVRSAIGVDPARGDKFEINSLPFENGFEIGPVREAAPMSDIYIYLPFVKYGLLALAALLVYLLLVRPLLKILRRPDWVVTPLKTVGEIEAEMAGGTGGEGQKALPLAADMDLGKRLREQVISQKAPYAQIIRSWLREG